MLGFKFYKNKLLLLINLIDLLLRMEGNSCISLVDNEILRNEKIEFLLRENRSLEKKLQMSAKESMVSNRGLCWTTGNEAEVVREFLEEFLPKPSCFSRVQLL